MTARKNGDISPLLMLKHSEDGVNKEPRSEGFSPRKYSSELLNEAGYSKTTPLDAIKAHCLECCGYSKSEVLKCISLECPLYLYRKGTNPWDSRSRMNGSSEG